MSPVSETTVVMPRSCSSNDAIEMLLRCSIRFYQDVIGFADFRVGVGVNLLSWPLVDCLGVGSFCVPVPPGGGVIGKLLVISDMSCLVVVNYSS